MFIIPLGDVWVTPCWPEAPGVPGGPTKALPNELVDPGGVDIVAPKPKGIGGGLPWSEENL